MFSKKEKMAVLNRILESETFSNSNVFQDLLSYLVNASINEKSPKEYAIATDVFHKGADFDPGKDTIVRVYIYNLRKKLEHYYTNEGSGERIRIEIPKGHYEINFVTYQKINPNLTKKHFWGYGLLLILIVSNIFFLYKYVTQPKPEIAAEPKLNSDIIWGDFFAHNTPKQVVLGDHFFFVKDSHSRENRIILRRDDINDETEFKNYLSQKEERQNWVKLRYPMFSRNSVWPFADILRFLFQNHQTYEINFASNITAIDIKNYDLIFVGSFHTLANFNQTFRKSKFSYKVYPNSLTWFDETRDSLIVKPEEGDPVSYHVDYGIVRKLPGPNNNIIFIFTSFHETGTIGIVELFTNPQSLKKIEEKFINKYGYVPEFFELQFKACGFNRTVYKTEIEYITEIKGDMKFW